MSNELTLTLVKDKDQVEQVRSIITNHHSYVPTYKSVGRRIDWLINYKGEVIGMIGVGSSTYPPCKDILIYLDMNKKEYAKIFNSFANNWRFCLTKKIPNIGTQILKQLRKESFVEWKQKYGDDLKYIITFVGGGHDGAMYKADNWHCCGKTAGLPPHKSSSMKWNTKLELKKLFVKPDKSYSKLIFIKKL